MMDFSRSSTHKAKKPHKCFLCGGKIAIGEKYERYTGKYDGDFLTSVSMRTVSQF